jgi:hypothetical protein
MSPYVPGRSSGLDPTTLPYMLYIPGIDGTGLAAYRQFPKLVEAFDLHAFTIPPHDRTRVPRLVEMIECAHADGRSSSPCTHWKACPCP